MQQKLPVVTIGAVPAVAVAIADARADTWAAHTEDELEPGRAGDRWWAQAAERGRRTVIEVGQDACEQAMARSDDTAIYALRKRLAEAKRVHVVAPRNAYAPRHGNTHVQSARERLDRTMSPARTR